MRTLALSFPLLPLEVVLRASRAPDRPVVLVESRGQALHVVAASREALERGVVVGSTHAHALAVAPDLVVRERRPEEERTAIGELARWATLVLSPRVAVVGQGAPPPRPSPRFAGGGGSASHALLVDATGLDHVHGSEAALLERATGELRDFGYDVRGAIADTLLGALALARFAPGIAPENRTLEALLPLPPRALGLDERALDRLAAVGIETIEQLLALPRSSLAPRFGGEVLDRIDRATGTRPDVLVAATFPETVSERLDLEGGTDSQEALALALEELGRRVLERLQACSLGARSLELLFLRQDAPPERFEVRLASPVSRLEALAGVLRERLERVDLGRPVESVLLSVPETARLEQRQGDLFSSRERPVEEDLACLLARLEGRLGARGVARPELVPDHRPERAFAYSPASSPNTGGKDEPPGRRPTRLLRDPIPLHVATTEDGEPTRFVHRGITHPILRAIGPERIESGFWDHAEVRRDYWIVADEAWRELWIYRELALHQWFLHGIFD